MIAESTYESNENLKKLVDAEEGILDGTLWMWALKYEKALEKEPDCNATVIPSPRSLSTPWAVLQLMMESDVHTDEAVAVAPSCALVLESKAPKCLPSTGKMLPPVADPDLRVTFMTTGAIYERGNPSVPV